METNIVFTPADNKLYFNKALTYQDYFNRVEKDAALNDTTDELLSKVPLNLQRMKRINKTFQLTDEAKKALSNNTKKRKWLVITENWCGDSAQITPVINALAENSGDKIEVKYIYRDSNPDLINAHLTNGGRAIPKLIELDENFEVTAEWGPRPAEAIALVKQLKSNPETASNYAEHLHKWYTTNKQVAIQNEIAELLK